MPHRTRRVRSNSGDSIVVRDQINVETEEEEETDEVTGEETEEVERPDPSDPDEFPKNVSPKVWDLSDDTRLTDTLKADAIEAELALREEEDKD